MDAISSRKHSRKRDAILETLKSTDSHPGAQWVYDRLRAQIPGLSLGTVYRNINVFQEEGSVVSLGVVRGEERFDAVTEPHPHGICTGCGRVIDLSADVLAAAVSKAGAAAGAVSDFTFDYRKTVFYGLCGGCREGGGKV